MKETKTCSQCDKTKPLSKFNRRTSSKDGYAPYCRKCAHANDLQYRTEHKEQTRIRHRKYHEEHKEQRADQQLQRLYGITLINYNEMLAAQDGKCAICGRTPSKTGQRLQVDHDHNTGKVRGLLCGNCNRLLSQCDDDLALLRSAAIYIKQYE